MFTDYTRLAIGGQRRVMPRVQAAAISASDAVALPLLPTLASFRLSQRFGLSPATAATVAALAGLGPQEVRR